MRARSGVHFEPQCARVAEGKVRLLQVQRPTVTYKKWGFSTECLRNNGLPLWIDIPHPSSYVSSCRSITTTKL